MSSDCLPSVVVGHRGTIVITPQIRERALRKLVMYPVCNTASTDRRSLSPTLVPGCLLQCPGTGQLVHAQACWDLQAKEKTLLRYSKGKGTDVHETLKEGNAVESVEE